MGAAVVRRPSEHHFGHLVCHSAGDERSISNHSVVFVDRLKQSLALALLLGDNTAIGGGGQVRNLSRTGSNPARRHNFRNCVDPNMSDLDWAGRLLAGFQSDLIHAPGDGGSHCIPRSDQQDTAQATAGSKRGATNNWVRLRSVSQMAVNFTARGP